MCSLIIRKTPIVRFYKKKSTRARCRIKPKKCVDGIALSADHKIPDVENESRGGHKKKRYSRAR